MRKIFLLFVVAILSFANDKFAPSFGVSYDESKAELGEKLFFDKRLSENGARSCETCHNLYWDFSGTSRKNLQNNTVNAPSVLTSALNYIFFNDGSVRDIYAQVKTSIVSNAELGVNEDDFVKRIDGINEYRLEFSKIYKDGIKFENAVDALVEFEKAILTVGSPFDKFLMGDANALSKDELKGLEMFKNMGCMACHNGINLGTNLKQQLDFYVDAMATKSGDDMTEQKMYRVPSLRNISRTAPYMRDGSILYLKDAILHAANFQIMHDFNVDDMDYIYKFLLTLNGEPPRILR